MLTIGKENRQFGADSFLEMGKQPKTTFAEFARVFGQKFDSDNISKMKESRFIMNDFVSDDRGLVGWKITVPGTENEQVLYSEEIVAQMLQYIKMLAETMAKEPVHECVITIPNWFTYDQRAMIKDAAESFSGMTVL